MDPQSLSLGLLPSNTRFDRIINGFKDSEEILQTVTRLGCLDKFQNALRVVKLWTKQRGIVGSSSGFLSGIGCSIMLARVCQIYPNASTSILIARFFSFYADWNWKSEIKLNKTSYEPNSYPMKVITPCYPAMCSTFSVGRSSLTLIQNEFKRAASMTNIADILEPSTDFFERYPKYLHIQILNPEIRKEATTKVRHFITSLEWVIPGAAYLIPSDHKLKLRPELHDTIVIGLEVDLVEYPDQNYLESRIRSSFREWIKSKEFDSSDFQILIQ